MSPPLSTLDGLRSLVDASSISERDGKVVASPQTTQELAAITRYANENILPIEIAGAGTKRGWGNPVASGIVLDMTRLAGIREHVWQDLTATVAAGTAWSLLQQSLAIQRQRVALDPLWPGTATVGGIIASNDSGALRSTYGSLRDLIIGMTVVLADGTIARTGGKVVKNVAGYDLHKLMTGAFGTLGVIAEVTFRLHPLPKSSVSWTIVSEDIAALDHLRHQIAASAISFEALQIRTCNQGFALDVALVSLPECMEDVSQKLHVLAAPLVVIAAGGEVWSARERSFVPDHAIVKITVSSGRMAALTSDVRSMAGECVVQHCGIMTATLPADPALISPLRERVAAQGGALTILHWPEDIASCPDIWGPTGDSFALMQEIKRRFDPNRILNPGRFVGGL